MVKQSTSALAKLALFATFFALGVIALGAFTRLIDAGLGCPDWPGCYGHLIVPFSKTVRKSLVLYYPQTSFVVYKAWAEMVHRYFVGALSIFILTIVSLIFFQRKNRTMANCIFAIFLLALLSYQIMLGQWTVTLKLLPVIVTQHLLGGFLILTSLWLVYLNNSKTKKITSNKKIARMLLPWAVLGLILLFMQIFLGAWTSTNYASLSCPDFPFCSNQTFPALHLRAAFDLTSPVGINYEGGVLSNVVRQTIQMMHRFGALIVTTYLFVFLILVMSKLKNNFDLVKSAFLILGLLLVQICLGISNVLFKLPLTTAILHNLIAALLLLSVVTFVFKLIQQSRASK